MTQTISSTWYDYVPDGCVTGPIYWAAIAGRAAGPIWFELQLARDPNCPAALLADMVDRSRTYEDACLIQRAVAEHRNTSAATLNELATVNDRRCREIVAPLPGLTSPTKWALVDDELSVRSCLSYNRELDSNLFAELMRHELCRTNLATNSAAPPRSLSRLFASYPQLVKYLARNPALPARLLRKIFSDSTNDETMCDLGANPNLPHDLMELVATSSDWNHRLNIAWNPGAPAYLLVMLATDEQSDVRRGVGGNPNTPIETLWALVEAENVAEASANGLIDQILHNPSCSADLFEHLAKVGLGFVRANIAALPHCPVHLLEELAAEGGGLIQESLGRNPCLPWDLLQHQRVSSLLEDRPLMTLNTAAMPELDIATAEQVIALARAWTGTIGDLINAGIML